LRKGRGKRGKVGRQTGGVPTAFDQKMCWRVVFPRKGKKNGAKVRG